MPIAEPSVQSGRRASKRITRRAAILDAAMTIVVSEGLDGLAIARLAKAVDAAVGAIYRYFPGKETIVAALQERAIGEYGEALQARLEGAGLSAHQGAQPEPQALALARLLVAFGFYLEHASQAPSVIDFWTS
jgi:AcrR family transcriptional regulator